jgi:23S rRNA (adenine1618-N6)-methyltransferase
MPIQKKEHPSEKTTLHPRNKHRGRYDFSALTHTSPELGPFVKVNEYGDESIDFFDPEAVKALNKSLLKYYYGINYWDIPKNYLCPPIPGRTEYIHLMADVLAASKRNLNKVRGSSQKIQCLDIGVGANCVYPIIGHQEYGWNFVGSDIDPISITSARNIIEKNLILQGAIEIRLQKNPENIFEGIIREEEFFDLSLCNPPFHASQQEAQAGSLRKVSNLKQKKITAPVLNFGGQSNELWCSGGESKFISDMILQSRSFADSCYWFSTLVSKQSNLKSAYHVLKQVEAKQVKTIPMNLGNKTGRILVWSFFS